MRLSSGCDTQGLLGHFLVAQEDIVLVPRGATNIRVTVFPQLCETTQPGCPPPQPPPPPEPSQGLCHPHGVLPPNVQLDVNLPYGDLIRGGKSLGEPGTFNVTECYRRCLAWNELADKSGGAQCQAWVATEASGPHPGTPHCWLKSHQVDGGFKVRQQACFVSAQCRVGVPASEFPCPSS